MNALENSFIRYIQQVYSEISSLGLSAGVSRLSTLGKFQHSVRYQEGLLALDYLFRLCDQFHCTDIPELFEMFFINEYRNRREQTIFLPPSITPQFQINDDTVCCTLAENLKKGCLTCSHFDACKFPRAITAEDLSKANWRCMICGNPLEFPTVLFQNWLSHTHHVKTQFLCCICFLEYSRTGEGSDILPGSELPKTLPEAALPKSFHVSINDVVPQDLNLTDMFTVVLGLISLLSSQFDDPQYPLHSKVPHPVSHDRVAWEAIQIADSQLTRSKFEYLLRILPRTLTSPRLDALFDYCLGFFEPQDIISLEDRKDAVFNFGDKFKDFLQAIMKSNYMPHIIAVLRQNIAIWDELNSWISSQFK